MNDKYADSIIKDPSRYDELVIHGVRDCIDPGEEGTRIEIDNDDPQFFSVYVKLNDSPEVECIGDFSTPEYAREYALEIHEQYGNEWAIFDYTENSESPRRIGTR